MHIGIRSIGRDWDLPSCPVQTKIQITHVRIKQSCLYSTWYHNKYMKICHNLCFLQTLVDSIFGIVDTSMTGSAHIGYILTKAEPLHVMVGDKLRVITFFQVSFF